jgi:uncharacterized membrane protein YjjB (DUF3815 family)
MTADLLPLLVDAVWGGLFAAIMAVLFQAPTSALLPCFVAGLAGRLARNLLLAAGAGPHLTTFLAATLVALIASVMFRRPGASPLVMVSALLPLAAAVAFFRAIAAFLRLPALNSRPPEALTEVMFVNLANLFTTTAAIGAGVAVAVVVVRLARRQPLD